MRTSSKKAKGARLQKWVCEQISALVGLPWGKDEPIASREMGQSGVDVRLVGKARELFPFSIECKNQETWMLPAWIKQARDNEIEGTNWLLVVSKNRFKPVIVMDAEAFFKLYSETTRVRRAKWRNK
jgi:hypothetical protein